MINLKKQRKALCFVLVLPIFFLFFINLASAEIDTKQADDVFKVNENIEYIKPCFYSNGSYCDDSATTCRYTFYRPDNSIMENNILATNVGANGASLFRHNISFPTTGLYKVDMACDDGTNAGSSTMYVQVTGSGFNNTFSFYILVLVFSLGFILMGFYKEDATLTLLGSFGLYFLALYILFNGLADMKDVTTTWAIGLITLGAAMYISVRSAHSLIVD